MKHPPRYYVARVLRIGADHTWIRLQPLSGDYSRFTGARNVLSRHPGGTIVRESGDSVTVYVGY